jgi:putative oxidoreductase
VNILLWVLQLFMGLYFLSIGVMHFIIPPGLPEPMSWMYELSPTLHLISGLAEILGGLGLILPAITRIQTRLVPLAAAGLVLVMLGAAGYHLTRGEFMNIGMNIFLALVLGFIAYGRWKIAPHQDRSAASLANR